jgi:hypothetical protein
VPIASLPLQAILRYRPVPAELAVPYLAAIAANEGVGDVAGLYAASHSAPPDLLEQPLAPNGHEVIPTFDLRRAIMQMQLDRGGQAKGQSGMPVDGMEAVVAAFDARSYSNAFVQPRASSVIEVSQARAR